MCSLLLDENPVEFRGRRRADGHRSIDRAFKAFPDDQERQKQDLLRRKAGSRKRGSASPEGRSQGFAQLSPEIEWFREIAAIGGQAQGARKQLASPAEPEEIIEDGK